MTDLANLSGFGNERATAAVADALPAGQKSRQPPPLGLYAERLSGTPFAVPRREARGATRPAVWHPSVGQPSDMSTDRYRIVMQCAC
jgi:homogentisate 1,2-dioxygenase